LFSRACYASRLVIRQPVHNDGQKYDPIASLGAGTVALADRFTVMTPLDIAFVALVLATFGAFFVFVRQLFRTPLS
jgi:hypothetical protein